MGGGGGGCSYEGWGGSSYPGSSSSYPGSSSSSSTGQVLGSSSHWHRASASRDSSGSSWPLLSPLQSLK